MKRKIIENLLSVLINLMPEFDYSDKEAAEKYYQHAQRLLQNADKLVESQTTADLYYRLAHFQKLIGNYYQAEIFYIRNLEICYSFFGRNHSQTGTSLNNLALFYRESGSFERAIELFLQALEIGEITIGKNHLDYAKRLNNLAHAYTKTGRYKESIRLLNQTIKIRKTQLGLQHTDLATSYNDLAITYK